MLVGLVVVMTGLMAFSCVAMGQGSFGLRIIAVYQQPGKSDRLPGDWLSALLA
jgi:hypothetical protein